MGLAGEIGGTPAELARDGHGELRLRVAGLDLPLFATRVDHRDAGGSVTFSAGGWSACYRRRGPTPRELAADAIDVTADEPWTWEDGDFGLLVFHVATGTGPLKYRHLVEGATPAWGDVAPGLRGRCSPAGAALHLRDVEDVSVKFELSGIWSELSLLVLRSPAAVVAIPVTERNAAALGALLAALPGWAGDGAIADAAAYEARNPIGPRDRAETGTRAERHVWP